MPDDALTGLLAEQVDCYRARDCTSLTAVDAAQEILALARGRVGDDDRVTFVHADLFSWRPGRAYDLVFLGFWLSHVPPDRFDGFWEVVGSALAPGGRVVLVDDSLRPPDELVEGEASATVLRRLEDGTPHRAVKVPYAPRELEERLSALGWDARVTPLSDAAFYWCVGTRKAIR